MVLDRVRNQLPSFAQDIKLNLQTVINNEDSPLSSEQRYGVALASSYATRHVPLYSAMESAARDAGLAETQIAAARTAATLMAMNNVYYRFVHLSNSADMKQLPAKLRMQGMVNHGIEKLDFELMALAVSAINGCGACIEAHIHEVLKTGKPVQAAQEAARIAAVVNAAAQALILS